MSHEKALGVAWAAFNHKDGNDHTALARAIDAYLSALVPDEVAGVVKRLRSHAADCDMLVMPEGRPRLAEEAASTLTALAARAEKAERELGETRLVLEQTERNAERVIAELRTRLKRYEDWKPTTDLPYNTNTLELYEFYTPATSDDEDDTWRTSTWHSRPREATMYCAIKSPLGPFDNGATQEPSHG